MADDNNDDTTTEEAASPAQESLTPGWVSDTSTELTDVQRTLSTFGMRIDALVTSTTSYRSAITDRLVEYTDLVSNLVRNQSNDLDEYRQANQRVFTELQRGIASSAETIGNLSDRLEKLLQGAEDGDDTHRLVGEVRTVLDAQESLSRFLTEALDQFGDRVTKTLTTTHESNVEQLDGLKGILEGVADNETKLGRTVSDVSETMRAIRESMVDLASGDVVGALWDEVRSLRTSVESTTGAGAADDLRDDVARLTEAIGSLLDEAEVVDPDTLREPSGAISELAADVAKLRADFTEGLVVEPSGAMTDTLDDIRAEVASINEQLRGLGDLTAVDDDDGGGTLRQEISNLTSEVRVLLEQAELVDEAGAPLEPGEEPEEKLTLADIAEQVEALRVAIGQEATDGTGGDLAETIGTLRENVEASRAEIGGIVQRLDDGLVLDLEPSADQQAAVDRISAIGEDIQLQVKELREVAANLPGGDDEATEVVVDFTPVTDILEQVRDDIAQLSGGSATPVQTATIDPDVVDVLREELRSVAQVPEEVLESLRGELVALRRRIKVRTDADALTDEQIEAIAKAVANHLG